MNQAADALDETHHASLRSWVESANAPDADFPIQNLPFGRYRMEGSRQPFRIGVAIGEQILDLLATGLIDTDDMNALMAYSPEHRVKLRRAISRGLRQRSGQQAAWAGLLMPQADAEFAVPCHIGHYTDFHAGIYHTASVGRMFCSDSSLPPNYKWMPTGCHGRSSSIGISGQRFRRPRGQTRAPGAERPDFGPCKRLDYGLELGFYMGAGNALGERVSIENAEHHLFGVTLLNDWAARDVQAWEQQPLGPFLAVNFASTVSPWLVTMDALAPFRLPFTRPDGDPPPLPYLDSAANRAAGALDIMLEALIQTHYMARAGIAPHRLSLSKAAQAAYWTPAQLVAHHTANGCNLQTGDMLGLGVLSGPLPEQAGSLLELTHGGEQTVTLPGGERRTFLEDGDTLILRGWCERPGTVRIGLGEARGTVLG